MRVLLVHNHYQQPGGEDVVFRSEAALLERHGHDVVRFTATNDDVTRYSRPALALATVWNRDSACRIRALIKRSEPDVVHVHNTFPLISPAIYGSAHAEGVPVVQTLHNYRLICPGATLYRDGHVCEACVARTAWPAVIHACYRNDRAATAVAATMLTTHRLVGTWNNVDRYIAMSDFARTKLVAGGLPAERIVVKPNFLDTDPGMRENTGGSYILFVGRLTRDKGISTLLEALHLLPERPHLKVAGSGPLLGTTPASAAVEWLGQCSPAHIYDLLRGASLLVMPSEWYEGCPVTLLQAFATGAPVLASRLGSLAEMVQDGETGLHFTPADPHDLARAIADALAHTDRLARLTRNARTAFERNFTAAVNYERLLHIYEEVIHERARATTTDIGTAAGRLHRRGRIGDATDNSAARSGTATW